MPIHHVRQAFEDLAQVQAAHSFDLFELRRDETNLDRTPEPSFTTTNNSLAALFNYLHYNPRDLPLLNPNTLAAFSYEYEPDFILWDDYCPCESCYALRPHPSEALRTFATDSKHFP